MLATTIAKVTQTGRWKANSFEKENMKKFELGIVKMDLESKAI
jgi:hypothetical protein